MPNRMPAEWEAHERTWMAWPPSGYLTADDGEAAWSAWANVANAVIRFEPVTVVVDPADRAIAEQYLDPAIALVEAALDDAWMRDIGPTFVKTGTGEVAGVDWIFNGWGAAEWAVWTHDAQVARQVNEQLDIKTIDSPMVNEGGGLHVNGAGVVLVTETVQLGVGRNHEWTKAQVEAELARTLGTHKVVWLKRGLNRDYDKFGTRGHVDIVAAFCATDTVLYHDQQNPAHPDFEVSREVRAILTAAGLKVIPVPAPITTRDEEGWVDYSYINHYVCNGAVILCSFDDANDERAREIFAQQYPDREIVLVDAREIFARGGGIHCITQQQPA